MSYVIQIDEHVDDETGIFGETELWEVRIKETGEVVDCCLDEDEITKFRIEAHKNQYGMRHTWA